MDCFSSASTCSDVSSDTGSVQSPYTPVQQTTSTHLTTSNMIDSTNYSASNQKFSTTLSSALTPGGAAATSQSNLDSSTNNLLSSIERDRKQREFIPDSKKDDKYWERRRKNNEAAKRSREKRRQNDILMECRINQLNVQNQKLHHDLLELKLRFGVPLNDDDKKFMENQSSSSPNDVYNGHHDDTELKLSEMDCCMLSTTKSRNDSLSMDDSQTEMILKCDQLSSVSPPPPPLLPQTPTTTATTVPVLSSITSTASIDPFMNSMMMTTSTSPLCVNNVEHRVNCEQPISLDLTSTNTMITSTTTTSVSNNFIFPQLNSLDNTDLLTLKRIFSSLGVGCLSPAPNTSIATINHSSSTSSSSASPLIAAAAAAAAAVAAVATNSGNGAVPLSPIPGGASNNINNNNSNNNNGVCATPTTVPFSNLSSLNTTAALLLRQAALMPASTPTPPLAPPSSQVVPQISQPQHQITTSCGLHDNVLIMKNDKLPSTSLTSVGGTGCSGGRCSSVHSVKSDISNNSSDYIESPLDLSLCCLQVKTSENYSSS
ncbi:Nuclear factor interleukin-3-regulated protein, partial [Schistosoma japonicum]